MSKNGKKAKSTRDREDKRHSANGCGRLGSVADESEEIGAYPYSIFDPNSEGENCNRDGRNGGFGGILRQLRELRDEHLAFVDAHSERLRTRLAEDERHRKQIISKMALLERQIVQLLTEQPNIQTDGNSFQKIPNQNE